MQSYGAKNDSPETYSLGETVLVHAAGTSADNFRIFLVNKSGWSRASEVTTIEAGDFDLWIETTYSSRNDDLANLILSSKSPDFTRCGTSNTATFPYNCMKGMYTTVDDYIDYIGPDAIIDLIPEDVLPYVVFNISLSINWDSETKTCGVVEYGYETAKSWLRTCAERGVWAMIQPSSGGQCHFHDYPDSSLEGTIFEEFFTDYPNFLGFNYCEQFWGFEQEDFPVTVEERYQHFANLLELCNKYGGYLVVSWCGNQWSPSINPLAMIKQVPEFEQACLDYTENFILLEKYTQHSYLYDMETKIKTFQFCKSRGHGNPIFADKSFPKNSSFP